MILRSETGALHEHGTFYCRCLRLIYRHECDRPEPVEIHRATRCTHRDSVINKGKRQRQIDAENTPYPARYDSRGYRIEEPKGKRGKEN